MLDFQKIFYNERNKQEKAITQKDMEKIEEIAKRELNKGKIEEEKNVPISKKQLEKEIEKAKKAYIDSITLQALDKVVKKSIGQRMMNIREEQRQSQEDLIAEFGFVPCMDKSVLSRWETGERRVNFFFLLWFIEEYVEDLHYFITGEKGKPSNRIVPELQKKLEEALSLSRKL